MSTAAQSQPEWHTSVHRDLSYVPEGGAAVPSRFQQLDLYVTSPTASAAVSGVDAPLPPPRPLLVFIHGGLWVDRDKSAYSLLGTHWSRTLGAHVAVINYRLSSSPASAAASAAATADAATATAAAAPALLHPVHTDDTLAALRWLTDPTVQCAHSYSTDAIFLVGHSCGAHIAGLIALAEPPATLLTGLEPVLLKAPSSDPAAPPSPLSLLRGCIGVEGIYDCARFVEDFPNWADGISAAFGPDRSLWESPQDYLPQPPQSQPLAAAPADEAASASRIRVRSQLTGAATSRRSDAPAWLVIHSAEDPWVNMPQAERFYAALLARSAAVAADSAAHPSSPSPALLVVSGAHFEVVERVGAPLDELTAPIGEFVTRCVAAQ